MIAKLQTSGSQPEVILCPGGQLVMSGDTLVVEVLTWGHVAELDKGPALLPPEGIFLK